MKGKRNNKKGKAAADDIPSWAKGEAPYEDESGKDFAERLLNEKWGSDGWSDRGPGSDYNKLKKYGDRAFD